MSKFLSDDLDQIVSDNAIPWDLLLNSTVLITGATGSVGSALVRALYAAIRKYGLNVKIIALGRNSKRAEPLVSECGAAFYKHDIRDAITIDDDVDYIFHCAAVTKSSEMAANPVGVAEVSLLGTSNILTLAKQKGIKSMVYLSSMEVYGVIEPGSLFITENMLGLLDINNPRSCYPESKRMCESLCRCSYAQYGVPVKTARLAQTFGAGTPKDDPRVFAQFARSAMAGEDIVLHTEGHSVGNYCYISDTVRALFLLLFKGVNGEVYNVVNPDASMTIKQMAQLAADKAKGRKAKVVVRQPADVTQRGYAPDTFARLSAEKIMKLGWKPVYGLDDMYDRMIADWSDAHS